MAFGEIASRSSKPNELTLLMGELVRQARIQAGMSQVDLANRILTRQATISDIENGKMELSVSDLLWLSKILEKPILYFFPEKYLQNLGSDDLPMEIQRLILDLVKLPDEDLRKIGVQIKALADFFGDLKTD